MSALATLLEDHESETACQERLYDLAESVGHFLDAPATLALLAGLSDAYPENAEFQRLLGLAADCINP